METYFITSLGCSLGFCDAFSDSPTADGAPFLLFFPDPPRPLLGEAAGGGGDGLATGGTTISASGFSSIE